MKALTPNWTTPTRSIRCSRLFNCFPRVLSGFFFQAEDGIRDHCVTGVQTCALPICAGWAGEARERVDSRPIVRIHLLGSMRATSYVGENILPRGRKARAILGCLCLAAGARIPRARLAALLWDRVPDDQARKSFRQALRELMVAMGPLARELMSVERETVRLDTSLCWVDAVA